MYRASTSLPVPEAPRISTWTSAGSLADLDGDGDLDLVLLDLAADQATWWENLAGDGSSWEQRTRSSPVPVAPATATSMPSPAASRWARW